MNLELIGQVFYGDFTKRMRALKFWTSQSFLKVEMIRDVIFVYKVGVAS